LSRALGRSGIKVSDIGFGGWAIGGPMNHGTRSVGWTPSDDDESIAAVRRALDLGITFFDTADVYGAGHSELVLGQALAGHRDDVVIATKFGVTFDEQRRVYLGHDSSAGYVRSACEASLRRLGTDHIDVYQLHMGDLPITAALDVAEVLEQLVSAGLILAYGWSTDDVQRAAAFADGQACTAIQHEANVLSDAPDMFRLCEALDLASINRTPLAMGLLTGKFGPQSQLPADDLRAVLPWVEYFSAGRPAEPWLSRISAIRDVLTSGGRTLAQGALCWLLARSPRTVPIPGTRTVAQAEENAGSISLGPLTPAEMAQVDEQLASLQA
jgi:aryl-alcohol dehydrogenase-like predicted oxidoreductase